MTAPKKIVGRLSISDASISAAPMVHYVRADVAEQEKEAARNLALRDAAVLCIARSHRYDRAGVAGGPEAAEGARRCAEDITMLSTDATRWALCQHDVLLSRCSACAEAAAAPGVTIELSKVLSMLRSEATKEDVQENPYTADALRAVARRLEQEAAS